MRRRSVVTALVVLTAGLTVAAARRRLAGRRPGNPAATPAVPVPAAPTAAAPAPTRDAVVLPFSRRAETAPAPSAAPARCGDTGGRTKAGAPCAARAASGGRCHHHRLAA